MQSDFAGLEVDGLAVAIDHALLQIDDAVGAERADHRASVRVERDHPVAGREVDDAIVTAAIGPVRHAAAGELAWRYHGALAFANRMRPEHFTGLAIERDH